MQRRGTTNPYCLDREDEKELEQKTQLLHVTPWKWPTVSVNIFSKSTRRAEPSKAEVKKTNSKNAVVPEDNVVAKSKYQ